MSNHYELITNNGQAPSDVFKLGLEYDVDGKRGDEGKAHWCVLVTTPYGSIPGKAIGDKAWYTYKGKEFVTGDFHYLKSNEHKHLIMVCPNCKPIGAIKGKLHDGGVSYMVICYNGERGSVPGRSDGKKAWFSMDGKEYETDDFVFVSLQGNYTLEQNIGQKPVDTDCGLGYSERTKETLWNVLCKAPKVALKPGSANKTMSKYTSNGRVNYAANFSYIRPLPGYKAILVKSSSPPEGALEGRSNSGTTLYAVICNVPDPMKLSCDFGKLPGFTIFGNNTEAYYCDTVSKSSKDFSYVVIVPGARTED